MTPVQEAALAHRRESGSGAAANSPAMHGGSWRSHTAAAFICLAAALINQSAVHWRVDVSDDRLFAYFGWLIGQGARPYLDFWDNKPPGIFWINALATRLDADGLVGAIVTCGAGLAMTLFSTWLIACSLFADRITRFAALASAAVLVTHLRFECGANRTETFVTLCETMGVAAYLRWRVSGRGRLLIAAALAFGTAPLFKQSAVAAALTCAADFTWTLRARRAAPCPYGCPALRPRTLLTAGIASLLPAAVATAALSAPGQLSAAYHAVVQFNRAYFDAGDASLLTIGPALRVLTPAFAALATPLGMALLGAILCLRQRPHTANVRADGDAAPSAHPPATRFTSVLWGWLLVGLLLAIVGPGRREYHLVPVLPALSLLSVVPLAALLGTSERRRGAIAPSSLAIIIIWAALFVGPARDSLEAARPASAAPPDARLLARNFPDDELRRGRLLREMTRPTDRIYVFGWSPGTYRFALRRPASRFCTLEKAGQVGRAADFMLDAVTADLLANPPAACFISPADLAALAHGRTAPLATLLQTRYSAAGETGGMLLYVLAAPLRPAD